MVAEYRDRAVVIALPHGYNCALDIKNSLSHCMFFFFLSVFFFPNRLIQDGLQDSPETSSVEESNSDNW